MELRGAPVIGDFLVVEMPHAGNERRMVVLPRPLDRFPLRLEGGEHVVRLIFDDEVFDCAAFRRPLGRASMQTFGILVSLLSENAGSYRTSSISALWPAISTMSPGPRVMTARARGET